MLNDTCRHGRLGLSGLQRPLRGAYDGLGDLGVFPMRLAQSPTNDIGCRSPPRGGVNSLKAFVQSCNCGPNIDQRRTRFDTQERALAGPGAQLPTRHAGSQANDDGTAADEDSSAQLTSSLQDVCQKTPQPAHVGPGRSLVICGQTTIRSLCELDSRSGIARRGAILRQSNDANNSRAFQGQMEASSFDKLFVLAPVTAGIFGICLY